MEKRRRKDFLRNIRHMLENASNICNHCPCIEIVPIFDCNLCRYCVGLLSSDKQGCPCRVLGSDEAVKRAWIAIEEAGLLDE